MASIVLKAVFSAVPWTTICCAHGKDPAEIENALSEY